MTLNSISWRAEHSHKLRSSNTSLSSPIDRTTWCLCSKLRGVSDVHCFAVQSYSHCFTVLTCHKEPRNLHLAKNTYRSLHCIRGLSLIFVGAPFRQFWRCRAVVASCACFDLSASQRPLTGEHRAEPCTVET